MTYRSSPAFAIGALDLHETLGRSHPKLERGKVWCRNCGRSEDVVASECLRAGWPKCCGWTMTIDAPDEREFPA